MAETWFHRLDHLFSNEQRRFLSRNERRADNDVHLSALFCKELHFCFDEFFRHGLGVTTRSFAALFYINCQKLGSE